jgi:hypothetical protein
MNLNLRVGVGHEPKMSRLRRLTRKFYQFRNDADRLRLGPQFVRPEII